MKAVLQWGRRRRVCEHRRLRYRATFELGSLQPGGPIDDYALVLRVWCLRCRTPFRFPGVEPGLSFTAPSVALGRPELRIPLRPPLTVDDLLDEDEHTSVEGGDPHV